MSSDPGSFLDARSVCRQWLAIAIGSLIIAGLQSLLLVVGRLPAFAHLFTDALFFRRALVVHVNLALLVWFYAFLVAQFYRLPSPRPESLLSRLSAPLAGLGVLFLVAASGIPGAKPILSNYVPVLDHPLFLIGLALFGGGVIAGVLNPRRLWPKRFGVEFFPMSEGAAAGIRAAAIVVLLATLTFAASLLATPRTWPSELYYEALLWGGGHVLQVGNVAGMTAVWMMLLEGALGRPALKYRTVCILYSLLVLPLFLAPVFALEGPSSRQTFTTLMRWGIFPVVSAFLVLSLHAVFSRSEGSTRRKVLRDPRVLAFLASAFLTVVGFVLGALIRGSSTLIPAHYHASIGAVTVTYMAITYPLLERLSAKVGGASFPRIVALQPMLFGFGQLVFALGFALAGAHGMARKAYGTEQHVRTFAESVGLAIMGVGGAVAVIAGVAFLVMAARGFVAGASRTSVVEGDTRWNRTSIRSRS